ncbi:MAG TPA: LPXTG cell wall anchor domain-containing protein, partial [Candidatus Intestinimonas stercorigallinarum]|nr:LPXTG cell wall anchor domain-containing protein [Candidatus Intestinimonas stercorigallinarum]
EEAMGLTIRLDNDGDGIIEIDEGEGEEISRYFTVELLKDGNLNDGFTFTITGNTSGDHIWAKSGMSGKVIVNYNAIVNKFAVVGGVGNPNEVDLEFSNNPNTDSTGETPKDIVTSFTYQLNVTKVDGKDENVKLEGARFALYRLVADPDGGQKKEYVKIDADNKVSGWQETLPTNGNIVTDVNGRMSVIGLDAGTYYLTECVAPDGYNLLDADVQITITAEYSKDGKTIEKLTVTVDDGEPTNGTTEDGEFTGELEVTVKNFSGVELPGTGGIGTTIFYTLGGLLAVGAAVFLVTKKRMSGVEE